MNTTVTQLFIHGPRSTRPEDTEPTPMLEIDAVDAVTGMGLRQDSRYFRSLPEGTDRKRQVSLIDEGTIQRLELDFGPIPPAAVKAQLILAGSVSLPDLLDQVLVFPSGAELTIALARKPCYAMDLIKPGLREAMEGGRQGALARVTRDGRIAVGDAVTLRDASKVEVPA